jgi:pyridoxine/pyridoxamine 5'-phosphate oxidase
MAGNFFIERQPDGRYAAKRPNAQRASAVCDTQAEAIETARQMDPHAAIHVERVRHTDVGSPDKWRKP